MKKGSKKKDADGPPVDPKGPGGKYGPPKGGAKKKGKKGKKDDGAKKNTFWTHVYHKYIHADAVTIQNQQVRERGEGRGAQGRVGRGPRSGRSEAKGGACEQRRGRGAEVESERRKDRSWERGEESLNGDGRGIGEPGDWEPLCETPPSSFVKHTCMSFVHTHVLARFGKRARRSG